MDAADGEAEIRNDVVIISIYYIRYDTKVDLVMLLPQHMRMLIRVYLVKKNKRTRQATVKRSSDLDMYSLI